MEPIHPVKINGKIQPKFTYDEKTKDALLAVEPNDIKGTYDFVINVESMQVNADEEKKTGRQAAVSLIATNPTVTDMLVKEGVKPKFKELFITWLEDLGFNDADRFFEQASRSDMMMAFGGGQGMPGAEAMAGAMPGGEGGIPGGANPNLGGETQSASPFSAPPPAQPKINEGLGPISPKAFVEENG
jgi:hypothetical protein